MQHPADADQPAPGAGVSRRRALGLGAAATGAAWVAPQVLSMSAAAAATVPPGFGTISGLLLCGNEPYGNAATVSATPSGGGVPITTTSNPVTGEYVLVVPAGSYDVSAEFGAGGPNDYPANPVTVPSGGTAPGIDIQMPC